MALIKKLITLALMIVAPIISGRAFYEYANVAFLNKAPTYPFGKTLMKTIQVKDIHYLSSYQNELLTIGFIFLAVSVIAYLSMMIRALVNMVWIALFLAVSYYLYHMLQ